MITNLYAWSVGQGTNGFGLLRVRFIEVRKE